MLCLVTGRADLDLGCDRLHGVLREMQLVAAGAGHVARRMRAGGPIVGGVRLVAGQAGRVLPGCGRVRLRTEVDHARQRTAACLHVRAARSVAGFALQTAVAEGTVGIVRMRMLGAEDSRDRGIAVASQAAIRAMRAVGTAGRRWTGCGGRCNRCLLYTSRCV